MISNFASMHGLEDVVDDEDELNLTDADNDDCVTSTGSLLATANIMQSTSGAGANSGSGGIGRRQLVR